MDGIVFSGQMVSEKAIPSAPRGIWKITTMSILKDWDGKSKKQSLRIV
jgi:hypothetical protein